MQVSFQEGSLLEGIGNRCFSASGLEKFQAPARLRKIGNEAFAGCKDLKRVVLNEGLERLVAERQRDKNGVYVQCEGIFGRSGLEEIVLPGTLREISGPVFSNCCNLATILVGKGCTVDVRRSVGHSVKILSEKQLKTGKGFNWDLPRLREVVVPDGIARIGER